MIVNTVQKYSDFLSKDMSLLSSRNDNLTTVTSADACNNIVHSLMCHRQGGESESFAKCAVESLIKKLKDKRDELDSLIIAITTNGSQSTKCVTIQRTLDGRIQVAGRKCFPHLIYARIWRWPDLHRYELRKCGACLYGFELKLDSVCVNPYHYDRVLSSADISFYGLSPSVDVSDIKANPHSPSKIEEENVLVEEDDIDCQDDSNEVSKNRVISSSEVSSVSTHQWSTNNNNNQVALNCGSSRKLEVGNQINDQSLWSSTRQSNNDSLGGNNFTNNNSASTPVHSAPSNRGANGDQPNGGISHGSNDSNNNNNQSNQQPPSMPPSSVNLHVAQSLSNLRAPEFWCNIAYFELDQLVGELFKVKSQHSRVTVDGYTDPSSPNRFCLGQLSNVHRSDQSEKSRLYIGKGVELDNVGEGDVWIRCLSELSVFVQSYYLDREAGRNPGDAVHKIYPGAYIKIFDIRQCYEQMRCLAQSAQAAAVRQAAAVVGSCPPPVPLYNNQHQLPPSTSTQSLAATAGVGVDDLRRLCMLRLSFVKGWGPDYPRTTIKETPCWIEIQLHRPLQLLDEVLQAMPLNDLKPTRHFFSNYYQQHSRQQSVGSRNEQTTSSDNVANSRALLGQKKSCALRNQNPIIVNDDWNTNGSSMDCDNQQNSGENNVFSNTGHSMMMHENLNAGHQQPQRHAPHSIVQPSASVVASTSNTCEDLCASHNTQFTNQQSSVQQAHHEH